MTPAVIMRNDCHGDLDQLREAGAEDLPARCLKARTGIWHCHMVPCHWAFSPPSLTEAAGLAGVVQDAVLMGQLEDALEVGLEKRFVLLDGDDR